MTVHTELHFQPIRARLRGDDPARPVLVGTDGDRIVLVADGPHAEVLARMIARVTGELRDVDDVDQVLWDHVTVDLLCAKALAGGSPADTAHLVVVR